MMGKLLFYISIPSLSKVTPHNGSGRLSRHAEEAASWAAYTNPFRGVALEKLSGFLEVVIVCVSVAKTARG